MADAVDEIKEALSIYFDGWHFADASKLEQVFRTNAHLYAWIGEHLDDDDMEKVLTSVKGRESPATRGETRNDRILMIDLASETTALAKVQLSIGPKLFTDYLSFINEDGRWKIIAKVFSITAL